MKRTRTYNKGASDERNIWMRKLRRSLPTCRESSGLRASVLLDELIQFGEQRRKRYEPKPGGVGRK